MTVRSRSCVAASQRLRGELRGQNTVNASDSRLTAAVVVLWRTSGIGRQCVGTALVKGNAWLGRLGFVKAIIQKTREFLESAASSLISAGDWRGQHGECT
jgi:hypothetical protein